MKNTETVNYYNKIKSLLPAKEFKKIDKELYFATNEQLEAFWNIIVAGFSVNFALLNFVKLHSYLQDKAMDYFEALKTFVNYPGLKSGIILQKTRWFELN
jgi:hypothetical protein